MSRSPTEFETPPAPAAGAEGDTAPDSAYIDAWRRLAVRIRDGNSFSGRERNCAFLNTGAGGGGRFADVSGAFGLDDPGDARGLATGDWDFDGDVDVWMTFRGGPRVRIFENRLARVEGSGFVALRLEGDPGMGSNRDAIGARVTLHLDGARLGPEARQVQTVHAGDAFLGQSSRWLHFGVPPGAAIDRVEVIWPGRPGAPAETFDRVVRDRFHLVRQGGAVAEWSPPFGTAGAGDRGADRNEREAAPGPAGEVEPEESGIRLRLSEPVAADPIVGRDLEGRRYVANHGPLLAVLFTTWCPDCADQMRRLAAAAGDLESAGLHVLALCVDGLEDSPDGTLDDPGAVRRHVEDLGFPFPVGTVDAETVARLDGLQKRRFYRQKQLPVPSAFLFDRNGALSFVYKGPFSVESLLDDLTGLEAAPEVAAREALPFPGRETGDHFVTHPAATARIFLEGGYPEDAREHLVGFLATKGGPKQEGPGNDARRHNAQMGEVLFLMGVIDAQANRLDDAQRQLEESITFWPTLLPAHLELVSIYERRGNPDRAARHLRAMLERDPDDANLHLRLGELLERTSQPAEAAEAYERAIALQPKLVPALNNLAWIRATAGAADLRDGTRALELARVLESSPVRDHPAVLDTIAAAYAEAGQMEAAATRARRALIRAEQAGDQARAAAIRERLARYENGRPWHEPAR